MKALPHRGWRWGVGLTIVFAAGLGASLVTRGVPDPPLLLRCSPTGPTGPEGVGVTWIFGRSLWVSNRCSRPVRAGVVAIEYKQGSNWITGFRPVPNWLFVKDAAPTPAWPSGPPSWGNLHPHGSGYGSCAVIGDRIGYAAFITPDSPAGSAWRVRLAVEPELGGIAKAFARLRDMVRSLPEWLSFRFGRGVNNPWTARRPHFGKPIEVLSDEVVP